MAEQKKLLTTHTFEGGLQKDLALEITPPNTLRHAVNIRILSTAGGQKGIVTNPKGNLEITFDLPAGTNSTIGRRADDENNRFFWMNWNSNTYHAIYMYDMLLNTVTPIITNLTDTNNIDILQFQRRSLILHIDVVNGAIYWANKDIKPACIDIAKALDKSPTGYGPIILAEYISAYKLAPVFPPVLTYFTDTTRAANYLYRHLFKATQLHVFVGAEHSNWSEFSTVPLPANESFTGNAAVFNNNNGLKITVETGSHIVKQIKIGLKIGDLDFVEIATLDKARLAISDNTTYDYLFYNDNTSYVGLLQTLVQRAFSYLWKKPDKQAFTDNAMIYGGALEDFGEVDIDLSAALVYETLFLASGTANTINSPYFDKRDQKYDFVRFAPVFGLGNGYRRNTWVRWRVGNDVKAGNKFTMTGVNGESDNLVFTYTAGYGDDAISVANNFKQQIVATGRYITSSEDLSAVDIWANTIDGAGNVEFTFIWLGHFKEAFTTFAGTVTPISTQSLKDNGQSLPNPKSGGSNQYGFVIWDEDGRRSAVYTSDDWFVRQNFVTESSGYKKITINLSILSRPPLWGKYWEVVRTVDLTYGTGWIQFLVQKVVTSHTTTNAEYQDLIIGSINTYQLMHPNTVVQYAFEKNDRVRLIREEPAGSYISFIETVVLEYKEFTEEVFKEDVITNDTAAVTIGGTTSADNVGRYISVAGVERLITAVTSGTVYQLDRVLSFTGTVTYPTYNIVDRRGLIRIRKPVNYTVLNNTLIEVYKPTQNLDTAKKFFYLFGQKYAIKDWGTTNRAYTGNVQNQNPAAPTTTPAIVAITTGTSYVRQRELPTNNIIPDTQVVTDLIEAPYFSDFYDSDLNDNGKVAPLDEGFLEKRFPDRLWHSKNYIQDTKINGLNDFDNTSREDYNDAYGSIKLIVFWRKILYAYKQLRDAYITINATIIQDDAGNELLKASPKLLNKMQYLAYEGGIGDHPESYASDQTWQYHAYPNAGILGRLGGDGVLPISEQFGLDDETRTLIAKAVKYNTFIQGGIDRKNGEYVVAFEPTKLFAWNGGFGPSWILLSTGLATGTTFEITTNAVHGSVSVITYLGLPLFAYTPTTDYVGDDYFYYRWMEPGGAWSSPKKACITDVATPTQPSQTVYYNALLSTNFTRSNCDTGYSGSVVAYVVPALKYSSVISQADADQQASDDATVNGQTYADLAANGGTCTLNAPVGLPAFVDQTGLNINTLIYSNTITVPATYPAYTISITGSGAEYSINGAAFTSAAGTIAAGDSLQLRRSTSNVYSTAVTATPNIGGVTDVWNITTKAAPNVTINWQHVQDLSPFTESALVYVLNGVEQWREFNNNSGTVTVPAGSVVQFRQLSFPTNQPWPISYV